MIRTSTIIISIILFLSAIGIAQNNEKIIRCSTDEMHAEKMKDPVFAQQFKNITKLIKSNVDFSQRVSCGSPLVIPVAVHFRNGVSAANTNCLIDKCLEQIEVLNEDFGGYNADIINYCEISDACPADYPPTAVTQGTCIQFCLPDSGHPGCEPAGNLINGYAVTVGVYNNDNASCWAGYMNIFVDGNLGGGLLGYAPLFGGSNPNGNGITVTASAFGGSGGGCNSGAGIDNSSSYGLGRTATHEAGHYFGLNHTFNGCGNGDGINDTPNQSQDNTGCPSINTNNCTSTSNNSCGEADFWFNYMDYVNDACMWMFTEDQSQLMYNTASGGGFNNAPCSPSQGYSPTYPTGCAANILPLELLLIDSEDLLCFGDFSGYIEVEATGGVQPYTYFINGSNNGNNPIFSGLPGNDYFIQVVDSQGETQDLTITINEPTALFAFETIVNDASCFGEEDGNFEIEVGGGTAGPQGYDISVNGTSFGSQLVFTDLAAGFYMIAISDVNDCEASVGVQIAQPPQLVMGMDTMISNLCWEDSLAVIDLNASGGTPGYMFSILGDTISNDTGYFNNLQGDTLIVLLTDTINCTLLDTFLIPGPDSLVLEASNIGNNNCPDDMDGEVLLTTIGGNGDFTYELEGVSSNDTGIFTDLLAGTYYSSAIDSNNCMAFDTFDILAPAEIDIIMINIAPVTCGGSADGQIDASAEGGSGNLSYSIDGTNFQDNGTFSDLTGGNYTLTVLDQSDCSTTEDIEITEDSPLALSIVDQVDAICFGDTSGSVTISAQGGAGTVSFNLDGQVNGTGVFTGLTTGTYSIIVMDDNDCTKTIDVEIDGSSDLAGSIAMIENISCFGTSDGIAMINGSGGDGNYMYSIDGVNFQPSNVFTSLNLNSYEVTIQDGTGCQYVDFFEITEPDPLEITMQDGTNLECFDSEDGTIDVRAIGGTGNLTYSIGAAALDNTTGQFSGLAADTYNVIITDENNCFISTAIELSSPPEITYVVSDQIDSNCDGDEIGAFRVTGNGGSGGYSYEVSGNPTNTTGLFTNVGAGSYTVIITDSNDCSTEAFVDVSSGSDIIASLGMDQDPSCQGTMDGTVSFDASGGTGTLSYILDGVANNTGNFTGLEAGNYTVSITDEADCLVTLSFALEDPDPVTSTVLSTTAATCDGGNNGIVELTAMGGTGTYTYDVNGDSNTTGVFNTLPTGSYNAIITDANNCQTTQSFTIDGPDPINGNIASQEDATCNGADDGRVTIASDLSVEIYVDGVLYDGAALSMLEAGIYDFELITADNCFETLQVTIGEPDAISVILEQLTDNPCAGLEEGNVSLSASGGTGTLSYSMNGETNTSGIFTDLAGGEYLVIVEDQNGCTQQESITISQGSALNANAGSLSVDTGMNNGSATINVSGGTAPYSYSLNNSQSVTTSTFENLSAGDYTVLIEDQQGCQTSLSFTIELMERPDNKALFNVTCTPNPTSGMFTLGYESNGEQQVEFKLFDARGQYIATYEQEAISGVNSLDFDFTGLGNGVLLLLATGERISFAKKIVKVGF